jgi:hypothetical protein
MGNKSHPAARESLMITRPMLGPKPKKETISIKKRLQIGDVLMQTCRPPQKLPVRRVCFAALIQAPAGAYRADEGVLLALDIGQGCR